jgi:hypothetical protein
VPEASYSKSGSESLQLVSPVTFPIFPYTVPLNTGDAVQIIFDQVVKVILLIAAGQLVFQVTGYSLISLLLRNMKSLYLITSSFTTTGLWKNYSSFIKNK